MPLMARLQDAVEETVRLQRHFLEERGPAVVGGGPGGGGGDRAHLAKRG
jgi:hypothetical protein